MNWFQFIFLSISFLNVANPKKLTPKENKILKANCGRYVAGFTSLSGRRDPILEEYKALYGKKVQIGEAPWAVSLAAKKRDRKTNQPVPGEYVQHGTGTLISPWHIVTAAHLIGLSVDPSPDCDTGELKSARFLRGTQDFVAFINVSCATPELCKGLQKKDQFKAREIKSLYVRKGYVGEGCAYQESQNDIAVFELAEPVEFSNDIFPACIPSSENPPKLGQSGYKVYGFGRDPNDKQMETGRLKTLTSFVAECSEDGLTDGVFCTSSKKSGLSCDGDSGSGVIRTSDTRDVEVLVGVLSAGRDCNDVYANHQRTKNQKNYKKGDPLEQETDLLVDVSAHLEFFCNCCGLCNK